jgi:hypothetical protein
VGDAVSRRSTKARRAARRRRARYAPIERARAAVAFLSLLGIRLQPWQARLLPIVYGSTRIAGNVALLKALSRASR